jgi:hypothetical protein
MLCGHSGNTLSRKATDEKRVAAEIYDTGDARQHDGDVKWTARQDPAVAAKENSIFLPW